VAEGVRLDVQVHAPSAGADPQIGAAVGFGTFANGVATGTDFAWQEVGIIRLLPGVGDGDYLGAGDVTGVLSERVGRFVPSHFTVTLNAPQFATACTIGGFTYQGQPFGYAAAPVITAVARSASGAPTLNYTGAFVKLSAATLENVNYTSPAGDLDAAAAGAPLVVAGSPGTVTLTFASGTGLFFGKGTPQAPFTANIRLAVDVLDADGVAAVGAGPLGNPVTFGSPGGIAFSAGAEVRYGRIRLATATGSELLDLPVRMVAEHYAGDSAGFVVNGSDVCSTVALTLTGFTQNLSDGDTCVRDSGAPGASDVGCAVAAALPLRFAEPPAAGDYNLRLAAPGAGNSGSVIVSASVPEWLRYDWNAGVGLDEDPSAQATFGVFGGESRQIYMREIY
jgi:MSHA biogenesis protein MshQ